MLIKMEVLAGEFAKKKVHSLCEIREITKKILFKLISSKCKNVYSIELYVPLH